MSILCRFGIHRYGEPTYDGPFRLGYGFERTFGNTLMTEKCTRCPKKRTTRFYLPELASWNRRKG